jgi:membrane fusion protein (multidrug efflux system)
MHLPRIVLPSLLAALLATAGCAKKNAAAAKATEAPPQPVEAVAIGRHDLVESLDLIGTITANESAQIRAEVAGLVREISFVEGQTVTKGQLLIKIDDTELAAQTQQAEASLELAKSNYDRITGLLQTKSSTPAEHERVSAELKTAQAQLALLRSRLAKTEIRAPFDGTVGARAVSPGDYVTNQASLTAVDDLSKLKIEFEVPELYLRRIRVGTPFTVTIGGEAGKAPVKGEVYFVSASISRETRSSAVKGLLLAPPADARPGMFANINLVLAVHQGALAVPEGAILNTTSGPRIVIADGPPEALVAKFVSVILGLRTAGMVEVTSKEPLEGRQVVAAGVGALALVPGMKLALRPAAAELMNARKD